MNESDCLRVASYNVHGCRGLDGHCSEKRIAEVIAALDVDLVGLQELDLNRRRAGMVDQTAKIADELGWHRVFHPALRIGDEQYGDAILSPEPMRLIQARELPSIPTRLCAEPRAAIWVEIETRIGTVQVINTHLGLGWRERRIQAELLVGPEWIGNARDDVPLVLMGDLNSLPRSPAARLLAGKLRDIRALVRPTPDLRTFPTRYPLVPLDYIFVNERLEVNTATVVRTQLARIASDHFPVLAELRRAWDL